MREFSPFHTNTSRNDNNDKLDNLKRSMADTFSLLLHIAVTGKGPTAVGQSGNRRQL
jgi:hypothetical protein